MHADKQASSSTVIDGSMKTYSVSVRLEASRNKYLITKYPNTALDVRATNYINLAIYTAKTKKISIFLLCNDTKPKFT